MENNNKNEQNVATTDVKVQDNTIPTKYESNLTTEQIEAITKGKKEFLSGLQHPIEFLKFIDWLSLPSTDRFPKTQKELALELDVTEDTLSTWKKRDGFWDEVRSNVKSQWKEKLGDVTQAMYLGIMQKRNASEFMAFMQYVDDFSPKSKIEGDGLYDIAKIEVNVRESRKANETNQNTTTGSNESVQGNEPSKDTIGS